MNRITTAAFAAFFGMGISAHAADVYDGSLKDDPVAYAPAPIWSGLYVGGHIGGLRNKEGDNRLSKSERKQKRDYGCGGWCWTSDWYEITEWSDWEAVDSATFESDETERSFLGGVHIGYNWQNGTRVYGLEGDVSFAKGVNYLASLRARLGHAVDNTLFYGTAGVAFVGFKDKTIDVDSDYFDNSYDIAGEKKVGLVVGGGVEHKLTSSVSIGLEGLYYFFGDSSFGAESGIYSTDFYGCGYGKCYRDQHKKKFDHEDDNDLLVVRARLNYHIQRDEPALDTYK
jgi:opacity protein-like surface antigen